MSGKGHELTIFNGGIENVLMRRRIRQRRHFQRPHRISAAALLEKPTVGSGGVQNVWGNTNRASVNGVMAIIFVIGATITTIVEVGAPRTSFPAPSWSARWSTAERTVSAIGTASMSTPISDGKLFVLNSGTVSGVNISSSGVANVSGGGTVDVLSGNSVFGVGVGGGGTRSTYSAAAYLGNVANDGTLSYDIRRSATIPAAAEPAHHSGGVGLLDMRQQERATGLTLAAQIDGRDGRCWRIRQHLCGGCVVQRRSAVPAAR